MENDKDDDRMMIMMIVMIILQDSAERFLQDSRL